MKTKSQINDKKVTTVFNNVVAKIGIFTKVDQIATNSVLNTPIVKLAMSFLVVSMVAYALYLAGNVVLMLVNLSLTQYLIMVSIFSVLTFIIMMVVEDESTDIRIKSDKNEDGKEVDK